ncbi:MAG: hypothetical protein J5476_11075 [Lachnospiraceae bacterium]|nr:hypothetical protein [Lachnospiraceae bacterium]
MEKSRKKLTYITTLILAITTVIVFFTNRIIPFMMDDLWYSTLLDSPEPITSFSDIIHAQVWHWHNWGGRSLAHGLLQLIILGGEGFADVLNTLWLFVLSFTIILCSKVSAKLKAVLVPLTLTAGLIIGLSANWKMSMFWEAGAANYLYITAFLLFFMFCYLRETDGEVKALPGITLWMIPLALIAGWSNENMGPTCFIVSVIVMYLMKKSTRKIPFWMIEGSIICFMGCILCIAAPGNFVRAAEANNEYGLLWKLFLRCYSECKALFSFQMLTLLTLAAVLIISIPVLGIKLKKAEIILLISTLLSWGAMVLSPHYPDRATFGTMCLMISVIISRSSLIIEKKKEALWPLYLGALLIWLKGMYDLFEFIAIYLGWIK